MSERLPQLLDAKALQAELCVTRATAEAIMRRLPIVQPDCVRKVFVKRADVVAYIESMTFTKGQVPHNAAHAAEGGAR